MKDSIKKVSSAGTMLAAAGLIGVSSILSGCFGGDDKPGPIDTVHMMVDAGKAIINFGINLSQWEDDVAAFIEENEDVLDEACPDEMEQYEIDVANAKKADEKGTDDEKGEALKKATNSTVELLKKAAASEAVESSIRTEADKLAKRYTDMYDEMKATLTKSMPDAGKEAIDKALDDAFKPAK